MVAPIVASVLVVVLLILSTLRMRHRERRRDSIARFADARAAMSVSQARPAVQNSGVTPQWSESGSEPAGVVVHTGSATLFDPIARRRVDEIRKSYRGDPDMLARRPTVAMLPTLPAAFPVPKSEAS